jgi:RNA 3'-terminal phosphate cyclase
VISTTVVTATLGATALVFQTVLLALLTVKEPLVIELSGGAHN